MTDHIAPADWNGWALDPNIPALIYNTEHFQGYQIDLDRILTNDDIVFWTVQIGDKRWPGGLDGFVTAITDLYDPHRRMNTLRQVQKEHEGQAERSYTPESIREAVAEFVADLEQRHAAEIAYAKAGDAMVNEPAPWGEGVETRTRRAQAESDADARTAAVAGSGNPTPAGTPQGG